MFMNRQELEAACGWVCFSDGQLEAVTRAWRKMAASPELEGLAREDARQLADPQGPTRLLADPETLRAQLGDEAGLYPVLILLSRVRWLCGQYERLGIERQVLTDTLSDIPLVAGQQPKALWRCADARVRMAHQPYAPAPVPPGEAAIHPHRKPRAGLVF